VKIRLVRHATLVIELDDKTLLIDPMLGPEKEFRTFLTEPPPNTNPTVPLPDGLNPSSILSSVHAAFITHTHQDHLDQAAWENALLKALPIFCQPPDEPMLLAPPYDFSSMQPVTDPLLFDSIEVFRTEGKHGPKDELGPVSGFVLRSQNEPTLYIAGDTIYCQEVKDVWDKYKPDIVIVNAGAAQIHAKPPAITMTKEDVADVCRYMRSATVIAVHMEAIDHCLLHRKELEDFIESEGLSARVYIPEDGERMEF
jgi:L-ascorbate metabolism protein UlaG (beta-lactamase superfamily)